MSVDRKPVVVIIGAGFGGLAAARGLRDAPVEVIVVDRANHHTFQPLLYQVATAGLSAPQISAYGVTANSHRAWLRFDIVIADRSRRSGVRRRSRFSPEAFALSGLAAWWTWLLVHIFFLIGFRNRITTMIDWMLAYFTHQRHARLIFGDTATRDVVQKRS